MSHVLKLRVCGPIYESHKHYTVAWIVCFSHLFLILNFLVKAFENNTRKRLTKKFYTTQVFTLRESAKILIGCTEFNKPFYTFLPTRFPRSVSHKFSWPSIIHWQFVQRRYFNVPVDFLVVVTKPTDAWGIITVVIETHHLGRNWRASDLPIFHENVMTRKNWPFVRGIHRSPVDSITNDP